MFVCICFETNLDKIVLSKYLHICSPTLLHWSVHLFASSNAWCIGLIWETVNVDQVCTIGPNPRN